MEHVCWLFHDRFANLTDLNRHLTSSQHTRLRVVCPWCLGVEKVFTRIGDLRVHCKASHSQQVKTVPPPSLARIMDFTWPVRDYRRIVSIGSWDSEDRFETRALMAKLCRSQPKPEMVSLHWRAGWAEALEGRPRKRLRDDSDVGEDPQIEVEPPKPIFPSPKRRVVEIPKRSKKSKRRGAPAQNIGERLEERPENEGTGRSEESKMTEEEEETSTPEAGEERPEEWIVGMKGTEEEETPVQNVGERLDEGPESGGTGRSEESKMTEEEETSTPEAGEERPEEGIVCMKGTEEEETPVQNVGERLEEGPESEGTGRSEESKVTEEYEGTSTPEAGEVGPGGGSKEGEDRQACGCKEETLSQVESETSLAEGDDRDLKTMAIEVLKVGVMPLCPPGRRNYTGVSSLDISIGERVVVWPPKNLSRMAPDEKLLAWEYFSMTLHHSYTKQFPYLSRQRLLDSYNFLALPGTRNAYNQEDRECRKIRFYNYQLLRSVARGDMESEEAIDMGPYSK